jgi:hypothetical protein
MRRLNDIIALFLDEESYSNVQNEFIIVLLIQIFISTRTKMVIKTKQISVRWQCLLWTKLHKTDHLKNVNSLVAI